MNTKDSKINKAMGAELRAERSAVGITQEDLAEQSGLSLSSLKRVLQGSVDIGIPQIAAIAAALDAHRDHVITPQDLVKKAVERAGGYSVLVSEVAGNNVTTLHPRDRTIDQLEGDLRKAADTHEPEATAPESD